MADASPWVPVGALEMAAGAADSLSTGVAATASDVSELDRSSAGGVSIDCSPASAPSSPVLSAASAAGTSAAGTSEAMAAGMAARPDEGEAGDEVVEGAGAMDEGEGEGSV
jgi:hypothetical protein